MTTEEIMPEIANKRARVEALTEQKIPLQRSHAGATSTIARAIAANRSEELEAARQSARTNSDQIVEIDSAIDLLGREIAQLEVQRREAEKREARESANQAVGAAVSAIETVAQAIHEAARRILSLAREADQAMGMANSLDVSAKSLNGEGISGLPQVGWFNKPGTEDVIQAIAAYAQRQEVIPVSHARVA